MDPCCSPKPALTQRPLIAPALAGRLADLFKVLANDTRLRMLHALARQGELAVTALAAAVGMKTAAVSNQLQQLALRGIVKSRRDGNTVFYRICDPCALELLDRGLCLTEDAAAAAHAHEPAAPELLAAAR